MFEHTVCLCSECENRLHYILAYNTICKSKTMVLALDGSSEHNAHMWSEVSNLFC